MTRPAAIGFFDSGIGGLSVLRHAHHSLCGIPLLYVADSAFAPYGQRDDDFIIARCRCIVQFLVDQGAEAVVFACNTATAAAIDKLRNEFPLPIIGIEPALKPAARQSRTRRVAVLATQRTLDSDRYARLRQACRDVILYEQVCHDWVDAVEQGELGSSRVSDLVHTDLLPLRDADIDTYVLGCTHFPFLEPMIRRVVGDQVQLIEPGNAVLAQLKRRLGLPECADTVSTIRAYSSAEPEYLMHQFRHLIGIDVAAEHLPACIDS